MHIASARLRTPDGSMVQNAGRVTAFPTRCMHTTVGISERRSLSEGSIRDPWRLELTQLVGYQRAEFACASKLRTRLIVCQFAIALPGAASVVLDDGIILYFLAAGGLALLLLWLYLDNRYRVHRLAGERARRATLVMQGLGSRISPEEVFDLRNGFEVSNEQARLYEDASYFATSAAPGYQRLAEMLQESAFWSSVLQRASAQTMGALFGTILAVGLVIIIAAVPFAGSSTIMIVTRVFLAVLVFGLSSDVLMAVQSHANAAREIERILQRLRVAASNGSNEADILFLMTDYNAAVEGAPVVVPLAYKLKRSTLNQRWADYLSERAAHGSLSGNQHTSGGTSV
jgi:hypothetical protein